MQDSQKLLKTINYFTKDLIQIYISTQIMSVNYANGFTKQYKISTSKYGIGNKAGSYRTPLGIHTVCEKFGDHTTKLYTIFKARKSTNTICQQINMNSIEDLILTGGLRLRGEEPGKNSGINQQGECIDSFKRYIYIHGTNREDLLGQPASIGCIRVSNKDIKELVTKINLNTLVIIFP